MNLMDITTLPFAEKGYMFMYVLADPFTGQIRYVGKATNPRRRFYSHISKSRLKEEKFHKAAWLKSLLKQNSRPIMRVIEKMPDNLLLWEIRENFWIDFFRNRCGFDLTNTIMGGGNAPTYGRLGKTNSEEHKRKCSIARKGRSIQQPPCSETKRQKIKESWAIKRANGYQYSHSEETKIKISKANKGKKRSIEVKEKCQKRLLGKRLYDNRRKIVQKDMEGNFLNEFSSVTGAGLQTKILKTSIQNCLAGRTKTAGKFIWEYKN